MFNYEYLKGFLKQADLERNFVSFFVSLNLKRYFQHACVFWETWATLTFYWYIAAKRIQYFHKIHTLNSIIPDSLIGYLYKYRNVRALGCVIMHSIRYNYTNEFVFVTRLFLPWLLQNQSSQQNWQKHWYRLSTYLLYFN